MKPLRTQFVIADGAHARWVKRVGEADDFVTGRELAADPEPDGGRRGVFESTSGRAFSVQERGSAARTHRAAFARQIAEAINSEAATGQLERLAVVAPARTLAAITQHLSAAARAKLFKTLAKDLSKTPDHELASWLRSLELG